MSAQIGLDITQAFTALTSGRTFSPGNVVESHDGKQFVYVKASSAIAQYDVVTYDETYITTVAPLSTSNDARGDRLGVAPAAIASGSYGFLQIYGPCTMNVLASCAANVRLNATTTAGSPDDDGTASSMVCDGMYLTTARGSTAGSAPGILNFPAVGATL